LISEALGNSATTDCLTEIEQHEDQNSQPLAVLEVEVAEETWQGGWDSNPDNLAQSRVLVVTQHVTA
jgi:hypothetical protein